MKHIQYAFGRDYLKNWTLKDALREIFQNYIDYGIYEINTLNTECGKYVSVQIKNSYIPDSLEFLRLGNTTKDDGNSIGHHGEGLKAAFLIFCREDLPFNITTDKYILKPNFQYHDEIGDILHIEYNEYKDGKLMDRNSFTTNFQCPKEIYFEFINSIITEEDILYSDSYFGDLLISDRGKGNIYSGGLFVCNLDGLNYSYNIKPQHLQLDRDRKVPHDWDVDYATSQILNRYNKHREESNDTNIDFNSRDYKHINSLSKNEVSVVKAVRVNNKVQYINKVSNEVITNPSVRKVLDNHPKFKKIKQLSNKAKVDLLIKEHKRKSVRTLLVKFKKDHCNSNQEMINDIDVILNKIKK